MHKMPKNDLENCTKQRLCNTALFHWKSLTTSFLQL